MYNTLKETKLKAGKNSIWEGEENPGMKFQLVPQAQKSEGRTVKLQYTAFAQQTIISHTQ